MTEQLSSEEATKRWELLLAIENLKPTKAVISFPATASTTTSTACVDGRAGKRKRTLQSHLVNHQEVDDPFDCSSVAVLPTHDIVEDALRKYLNEWKQLDDRKVGSHQNTSTSTITTATKLSAAAPEEIEICNNENADIAVTTATAAGSPGVHVKATTNTNHGGGWRAMEDRLSLPEGFDYNTKSSSSQQLVPKELPVDDGYSGDRVISLVNPAQTLSYHRELWKLFDSIPTCRELEKQARTGYKIDNTLRVYQEIHALKGTSADCHALSRLRMPDRHGLPQSPTSLSCHNERNKGKQNQLPNSHSATVLFEFWRKEPKRGMAPDCHRMVMEFMASQTLWDVHVVLAQMAEDDLWTAAALGNKASEDGDNTAIGNTSMIGGSDGKEDIKLKQNNDDDDDEGSQHDPSGCFFIENTFYKTGSVDYAKPIIDWIDGNNSIKTNPIRRRYLGINPSVTIKSDKTMKETKLSQVPFRLNIRYYHACHGDVETAVMLVDRKLVRGERRENDSEQVLYPLIHDIWTAPRLPAVPLCDACQIYQAVFATSTDCKTTDGGPRSLCHECCRDLKLLENEHEPVKLNRPWRNQANLSNRIAREHGTKF